MRHFHLFAFCTLLTISFFINKTQADDNVTCYRRQVNVTLDNDTLFTQTSISYVELSFTVNTRITAPLSFWDFLYCGPFGCLPFFIPHDSYQWELVTHRNNDPLPDAYQNSNIGTHGLWSYTRNNTSNSVVLSPVRCSNEGNVTAMTLDLGDGVERTVSLSGDPNARYATILVNPQNFNEIHYSS